MIKISVLPWVIGALVLLGGGIFLRGFVSTVIGNENPVAVVSSPSPGQSAAQEPFGVAPESDATSLRGGDQDGAEVQLYRSLLGLFGCKELSCRKATQSKMAGLLELTRGSQEKIHFRHQRMWTDLLVAIAEAHPRFQDQIIEIMREFEGPESLRRMYDVRGMSALSKAHLIEASLHRREEGGRDALLEEEAHNLVESMINEGSAAEALSALSVLEMLPSVDDSELQRMGQSLCRFRSQGDLEFNLVHMKWKRVAKRNLSAESIGPCRGT